MSPGYPLIETKLEILLRRTAKLWKDGKSDFPFQQKKTAPNLTTAEQTKFQP